MAWIEVHQTLPAHRKIKKFKRLLKIKAPQAVGHIIMLWLWAIDNASDGILDGLDPEDISEAAEWTGDAGKFLDALKDAGFVDGEECLSIHDWQEYTGKLMDKRDAKKERDRERQRQYRNKKKERDATVTTDDSHTPVTRDTTATGCDSKSDSHTPVTPLYSTVPYSTVQYHSSGSSNRNVEDAQKRVTASPKSQAVSAYCKLISATPSTAAVGELVEFEKELGTEVCLKAIDEALDANARSWKYIRAVLARCKETGVKSLADWDRQEAQRQTKKTSTKDPAMCETVDSGLGYAVPTDPGDLDKLIKEGLC